MAEKDPRSGGCNVSFLWDSHRGSRSSWPVGATVERGLDFGFSFRPGELDRAAHRRSADDARTDPRSRTLVFWRGKLLADDVGRPVSVLLGHPALRDGRDRPLVVGLTPAGPLFAADIPLWSPA